MESTLESLDGPVNHRHTCRLRPLPCFLVTHLPVLSSRSHQSSSRESNWVVSGSFDRSIKLWDPTLSSPAPQPLLTLNPPDTTVPKASIYAITADPYGHAIASGSPERVIRMWDPRSGKRTAKLVGHTDNIRAIVISDDARYVRLCNEIVFAHILTTIF